MTNSTLSVIDGTPNTPSDRPGDIGLTVSAGRVRCPRHNPCPTGAAKWADVRRYGGDAARFAFVTGMWQARGWSGAHAPLIEREFIAAHQTDEQRQAREMHAGRASEMRASRHFQRRDSANGA